MAAALAVVAAAACGGSGAAPDPLPSAVPSPPPRPFTVVAVGDIVCAPGSRDPCRHVETLAVAETAQPDLVLPLGDNQYESGTLAEYAAAYEPSWGRLRARSRPVPGNHEYLTEGARGYFDYFDGLSAASGPAGDRDKGYYSYDAGGWHFVALNANCGQVRGGCGRGSPQETWLRADLLQNQRPCTLAYSHQPRFSSGINGSTAALAPLWQDLYDAGADVWVAAHDHHYERFAAQRADGTSDPDRGLREFVVGTGGRSLTPFMTILPNSEVQDLTSFGVLVLRLGSTGYDWRFTATPGMPLADAGSGTCH
jgi:hypothetical protein